MQVTRGEFPGQKFNLHVFMSYIYSCVYIMYTHTGDEDDSEDESDEDEERPLSRDELKAKTLRGLTKREGQQMTKQQKRKNRKGDGKLK
jgi:hypothetical protein